MSPIPREVLYCAKLSGRPRLCEPTAEDLQKLRAVYVKTNRGRTRGSKVLAARMLARAGELSETVTEAILKPRSSKALPKALRDQMHVPPDIVRHHRSPRNARLAGFYIPGGLRMARDDDGLRRLRPGERQSWDDATINFGVCVPWPWGGDRCADKYGVKLGRFQLLTCIDDASDFCPGFSYVIRPEQSYRAEDTVASMFRLWRDQYAPERVMLEGGAWQAKRAHDFYRAAGIGVEDATGRPNNKLIEQWFNKLWDRLSTQPGDVGRFRGEMEAASRQYLRCRAGRDDPRPHFPLLDQAISALEWSVTDLNTSPVESKKYGTWVPQQMHEDGLQSRERPRLSPQLAYLAAPIVEERMIRRNMVAVTCPSPFGDSFPYHFSDETLWQFEGARARVYFDPYDFPLRAAITLASEFHGHKAGEVICPSALCLDDAPAVLSALDGLRVECDEAATARAIAMRNRIWGAIRREYRALGFGGKRVASATEARGPGGMARIEIGRQADITQIRGLGDLRVENPAAVTGRGSTLSSPDPVRPRRAAFRRGIATDGIDVDPALVADVDAFMRDDARSRLEEIAGLV